MLLSFLADFETHVSRSESASAVVIAAAADAARSVRGGGASDEAVAKHFCTMSAYLLAKLKEVEEVAAELTEEKIQLSGARAQLESRIKRLRRDASGMKEESRELHVELETVRVEAASLRRSSASLQRAVPQQQRGRGRRGRRRSLSFDKAAGELLVAQMAQLSGRSRLRAPSPPPSSSSDRSDRNSSICSSEDDVARLAAIVAAHETALARALASSGPEGERSERSREIKASLDEAQRAIAMMRSQMQRHVRTQRERKQRAAVRAANKTGVAVNAEDSDGEIVDQELHVDRELHAAAAPSSSAPAPAPATVSAAALPVAAVSSSSEDFDSIAASRAASAHATMAEAKLRLAEQQSEVDRLREVERFAELERMRLEQLAFENDELKRAVTVMGRARSESDQELSRRQSENDELKQVIFELQRSRVRAIEEDDAEAGETLDNLNSFTPDGSGVSGAGVSYSDDSGDFENSSGEAGDTFGGRGGGLGSQYSAVLCSQSSMVERWKGV